MSPYLPARVAAYDGTNREADLNNEVKNCITVLHGEMSIGLLVDIYSRSGLPYVMGECL